MRKPIIAGNWKMHGTQTSVETLLIELKKNSLFDCEIVVFPPYVYLSQTKTSLYNSTIKWGAQNLCSEAIGAFTGEIAAEMLADFDCHYVLIGHSERRFLYAETNDTVTKKFLRANDAMIKPILCVGETLQQREQGQTFDIIEQQLEQLLEHPFIQDAIIAYEPIWAIGTGKTATGKQAQEVHAMIRQLIANHHPDLAQQIRIIYGGSVKANNAAELFAQPDIDGGLIGGASLDPTEFLKICAAAQHSK